MNKAASLLKPLMPIVSAAYGLAIIYVTALPLSSDNPCFVGELLIWMITKAGIALTLFLVHRVEPKVLRNASQFSLMTKKPVMILPDMKVFIASLCLAITGAFFLKRND